MSARSSEHNMSWEDSSRTGRTLAQLQPRMSVRPGNGVAGSEWRLDDNRGQRIRVNYAPKGVNIGLEVLVGLFGRNKVKTEGSASALQVPDEIAIRAKIEYGNGRFAAAASLYGESVDKLHTMYVVGGCRYRQPSPSDSPITEGLVSAVGAALAVDPSVPVRSLLERSADYLSQILQMPQAAAEVSIYESAIGELTRLHRTAVS